jgi:hypothetical protein
MSARPDETCTAAVHRSRTRGAQIGTHFSGNARHGRPLSALAHVVLIGSGNPQLNSTPAVRHRTVEVEREV